MGRIMAVDYGERRVGLAVSDELGLIATGLETIDRRKLGGRAEALADEITRLAREHSVEKIVVGLPLNMDGSAGESAERATGFSGLLQQASGIEVLTWDERLTTAAAIRVSRELELPLKKRRDKKRIDRLAAVILLQNYLACHGAKTPGDTSQHQNW